MVDKESVKKFLESEIFSTDRKNYPESQFILDRIKQDILLNIDKPNIDVVDLVHFAVSRALALTVKAALEEEDDLDHDDGLPRLLS